MAVPTTRAQIEQENARLWETLEAIYDKLRELFQDDETADEEE